MNIGKTIRIYLDDGDITGIRHAEIINWTGQAVCSPRIKIKQLINWSESQRPGVYFLFGIDSKSGEPALYIGEAEHVLDRLNNHLANKDFWNEAIFFTSKDENLTKSHVKYLEARLIQLAKTADRYILLNTNNSQPASLPRGDQNSMEEFIRNLRILLGALGHKALELITHSNISNSEKTPEKTFHIKNKNIHARSTLNNEGMIVLQGSTISQETTKSLSTGYQKLRSQLIENKTIVYQNNKLTFTKDYLFTSPSQAAAVISGHAINGRIAWCTEDGISLKESEEI